MDNQNRPEPTPAQIKASQRKLLIMFVTPVIAIGLATLVYMTGIGIPKGTTNKGTLLQPPVNISDSPLLGADGQPWAYPVENDWTLINIAPATCDETCRERIYLTRQVRTAIGREANRISRMLITPTGKGEASFESYLAAEHDDLQRAHADGIGLGKWLAVEGVADPYGQNLIMLADQNGFVMMYYTPEQIGKELISDLKFLLKNSREKQR